MDEAKSVVSNLLSPCDGTDVTVPRKKDSSSVINKDEECSISPIARENEKKNQRKEICSVYSGQKPTVYINPIVQTESPLTDSSLQMDITINQPKIIESSVSSIGMQPVIEVLNEEGTDVHQELVVSETTEKNRPKTDRRRRQRGTIVWEPLLVPSEMDGKIEMVTALKRVDSDYISTPRTVPKKHDIHLVKPSTFRPSPKALLSPVLPIKSSKPLLHKVTENSDNSHHSLSVSKSRASGSNIKVQMNKAIAEKEASILKEIETAMREAAKLKNKSSLQSSSGIEAKVSCLSSEQPRSDAMLKITPSVVSKRKKTTEIPGNSAFDGSNQTKGLSVTAESSFPADIPCLPDTGGMFVGDSVNDLNDKKDVFQAPVTADDHQTSSSKDIITTFGAVVTSCATNDGNELHGMHKILTLPSKVSPTLTNVTKDLNPINRIVASTTSINSKSPSSLQRILLLTTPGGKNVNGDNVSHIPVAPIISSPSKCASNAKLIAKENKVKKNTVSATDNPQDVHLVMANLPVACEKSIHEESSSHANQRGKIVSKKNLSSQSHNSRTGNIQKELPSKKNITKSFPKKKQKTDKPKNRELASLVIDCVNAPTPTKSVLRTRTNRLLSKSSEDKSRFNTKMKSIKGSPASSSEGRKTTDQKSPVAKLKNTSQEQGPALDKKRQKIAPCIKVEEKDSDSVETLKERLTRVEQLYNELPPCQPYISLSPDDYSKVRDTIRGNLQDLNFVSESMKSFIRNCDNGEFSLPNKGLGNMGIKASNCKSEDFKGDHILCRLCGGLFIKQSVIALFSDFGKEKNLSSMFSALLPQSPPFRELDGLPQHVCLTCTDKLTLCFNIINQFLQADKELRNVLHEKKEDSIQVAEIENKATNVTKQSMVTDVNAISDNLREEKNKFIVNDSSANCKMDNKMSEKPNLAGSGKGKRKRSDSQERDRILDTQKLDEYQENSESDSKRLCTVNPSPNHKHKRKRSKSPRSNKKVEKPSLLSKTPSGCIDLSRLDPEFNDGYEVEWCLDEETIRSSLMPDENTDEDDVLNPVTPGPSAHDSLKHDDNPDKTQTSSIIRPCETSTDSSVSRQKKDPLKKDECLGSEKLKPADEVSKLSETRSSVCEPSVTSGGEQNPLASSEDKSKTRHFNLFHSQETVKCSSCPLSFPTKQEAFLHKVMKHEEELMSVIKPQYSKLYSGSAKRTKDSPKPVELSNDSSKVGTKKIESGLIQDSKMCDECGLAFPNEYSLYIHKCVIHDTYADSQSKDAKGVEYKIINSKELAEEIEAHNTTEETDGKILVKCGSGMLWVSSSKLVSEEPKTSGEAPDRNGVSNVSVENGILSVESSKQSAFSDSSQDTIEVLNIFECDHCTTLFPEKSLLFNHLKTHEIVEYSCNECYVSFPTIKALSKHLTLHIPTDHVCDECGLLLIDSKKLLLHRKEHTRNLPHVCESCGKRFPNEQTLEVHEIMHLNKRGPFSCSLCKKCFFFKHSIVRHRSQHASNRLQKCSLCFRVLNSSDQLRKHVALHHLTKKFVCFCKQTFPSPNELVEHRYLKHSYAEIFCARNKVEIVEPFPLHQCSICFRVLTSKLSLQKHHRASHRSIWPYHCIQCNKKFISRSHLDKHDCHKKTSAFQCRICGKIFLNKIIFKQHTQIHAVKKQKCICRHCGQVFQRSNNLVSYNMKHGDQSYPCPRCVVLCNKQDGVDFLRHK